MGVRNNLFVGVTAAVVATVIAPVLVPVIARAGRPFVISLMKGGVMLYQKGREMVAETGEMLEDVMAEVQADMNEERPAAAGDAGHKAATASEAAPPQETASVNPSK